LEVDGLGEKNIQRIINSGLKTIPQILAASLNDFTNVENFKIKMATRIYNSIHQKINNAELSQIAAATNIFKRGLGEKIIKTILLEIPDIFTQEQSKEEQIKNVNNIKGLGKKTAIQFVENIPQFIEFINNSNLTRLLEKKIQTVPKNNKLNMNIVFSGIRDKILIKQLEDNGAKIQPSITKTTNLLIIKNDTIITSKLVEAKLNNIPIKTIDAFKTEYNL
jgi:NAD-dependent DNA ligase